MGKTIQLDFIGYRFTGEVDVEFWDGDRGQLKMGFVELFTDREMSMGDLEELAKYVANDNGFGVRRINEARVDVYELYEHGIDDYVTEFEFIGDEDLGDHRKTSRIVSDHHLKYY